MLHPGLNAPPEFRIKYNRHTSSSAAGSSDLIEGEEIDSSHGSFDNSEYMVTPERPTVEETRKNVLIDEISEQTSIVRRATVLVYLFLICLNILLYVDFQVDFLLNVHMSSLSKALVLLWGLSYTAVYPPSLLLVTPRYRNQLRGIFHSARTASTDLYQA